MLVLLGACEVSSDCQPTWCQSVLASATAYAGVEHSFVVSSSWAAPAQRLLEERLERPAMAVVGLTARPNARRMRSDKFPDPEGLVAKFNAAGMRVAANLKPCLLDDHPMFSGEL